MGDLWAFDMFADAHWYPHKHTHTLQSLGPSMTCFWVWSFGHTNRRRPGMRETSSCKAVLTQLCPSGILNKFAHVCQTTIRSSQWCHQMQQNQLFSSFQTRGIPNVPSVFCGGWLINQFGHFNQRRKDALPTLLQQPPMDACAASASHVSQHYWFIYQPPPRRFCFHLRPFVGWWVCYRKSTEQISIKTWMEDDRPH